MFWGRYMETALSKPSARFLGMRLVGLWVILAFATRSSCTDILLIPSTITPEPPPPTGVTNFIGYIWNPGLGKYVREDCPEEDEFIPTWNSQPYGACCETSHSARCWHPTTCGASAGTYTLRSGSSSQICAESSTCEVGTIYQDSKSTSPTFLYLCGNNGGDWTVFRTAPTTVPLFSSAKTLPMLPTKPVDSTAPAATNPTPGIATSVPFLVDTLSETLPSRPTLGALPSEFSPSSTSQTAISSAQSSSGASTRAMGHFHALLAAVMVSVFRVTV